MCVNSCVNYLRPIGWNLGETLNLEFDFLEWMFNKRHCTNYSKKNAKQWGMKKEKR